MSKRKSIVVNVVSTVEIEKVIKASINKIEAYEIAKRKGVRK